MPLAEGGLSNLQTFVITLFSREEFAVSAATYLNKIPADAPEDPFELCISLSVTCPFPVQSSSLKGKFHAPSALNLVKFPFLHLPPDCHGQWLIGLILQRV